MAIFRVRDQHRGFVVNGRIVRIGLTRFNPSNTRPFCFAELYTHIKNKDIKSNVIIKLLYRLYVFIRVDEIYGRESQQAVYRTKRFLSTFNEVIGNSNFFKFRFKLILLMCTHTLDTVQTEINSCPEDEDTTERKKLHKIAVDMITFLTARTVNGIIYDVLEHLLR